MITGSNGPSYVTIVVANPTPLSGDGTSDLATSQFFRNKGAVAGVFLIVGLAAASILLFLFFFIRRRRSTRIMEHDTTVASTLAAAGFNRTPLDGDDFGGPRMRQRHGSEVSGNPFRDTVSSLPSATGGRPPSAYMDDPAAGPEAAHDGEFDPYAAYGTIHPPPAASLGMSRNDGYAPARTSSPPLAAVYAGHSNHGHSHSTRSESTSSVGLGHMARASGSSHDLLLGSMRAGSEGTTPAMPSAALNSSSGDIFTVPPRNPQRLLKTVQTPEHQDPGETSAGVRDSMTSSVYSMAMDDQTDEPSTSRPALEVRNLPDGASLGGDVSRAPSRYA